MRLISGPLLCDEILSEDLDGLGDRCDSGVTGAMAECWKFKVDEVKV